MQNTASPAVELDPLSLLVRATGPVMFVNWALVIAAVAVWTVLVLKLRELGRMRTAEVRFQRAAEKARTTEHLRSAALANPDAPGARVALAVLAREEDPSLAGAESRRAIVLEEQRASALFGVLSTVGASAPFVGLFGTVWGILDAFLRIGREKSASLPVVAPAIGEALISTAAGLFAAIPAVIAFNVVSKRADDMLAHVEAAADGWVALVTQRRPQTGSLRPRAVELQERGSVDGGASWAPR